VLYYPVLESEYNFDWSSPRCFPPCSLPFFDKLPSPSVMKRSYNFPLRNTWITDPGLGGASSVPPSPASLPLKSVLLILSVTPRRRPFILTSRRWETPKQEDDSFQITQRTNSLFLHSPGQKQKWWWLSRRRPTRHDGPIYSLNTTTASILLVRDVNTGGVRTSSFPHVANSYRLRESWWHYYKKRKKVTYYYFIITFEMVNNFIFLDTLTCWKLTLSLPVYM